MKAFLTLVLVVVLAIVGLFGYLTIAEYKPDDVENLAIARAARNDAVTQGEMLKVVSFNTGYAGLDRTQDFFMDGGTRSKPNSKAEVEENAAAILSALVQQGAQVYFLQEVDEDSARSYYVNQADYYFHGLSMNSVTAYNYVCDFVPIPWPPIGKVKSGLMTLTSLGATEAVRESLPVPFLWPLRTANLKRCLLIERVPVEGTDKELVLVNLHLEAYDSGEGKVAQTKQLMQLLSMERSKGNYVIAGGDFNQTFQDAKELPVLEQNPWLPGKLLNVDLPEGFRYVIDEDSPTCRSLMAAYEGDRSKTQMYIIDGFIVSDNLKVNNIETVDLNFRNSDHNPVSMQVTLQ